MTKFRVFITSVLLFVTLAGVYFYLNSGRTAEDLITPIAENIPIKLPLKKYTYENLKDTQFTGSKIEFGDIVKDEDSFSSQIFYYNSEGKKISGLANIPDGDGPFPVVVMLRGYVDKEIYEPGVGSRRTAEEFAKTGYITLAPDFLGYGESDMPSKNVYEERFEKYPAVLNLLASIKNLDKADPDKIGIWGHSNGGHIALAVLEITGESYPTVLWAPVSKPFPYSILYFTDEYEDHGKALRRGLADFERFYDVEEYSTPNFYNWINKETKLQLHHGGNDEAIPKDWSDELYEDLQSEDIDISYYTYPLENHNFTAGSWETAVGRSIAFFEENLE